MRRFLQIAMGSSSELEYQALLARDLGFLRPLDHRGLEAEIIEVKKMLSVLMQRLKADS